MFARALYALARAAPFAALLPGLSRAPLARPLVALALAGLAWPALGGAAPILSLATVARELLVGASLGWAAMIPLRAVESAGVLVGEAAAGEARPSRAVADGCLLLGLAVFATASGPRLIALGWIEGYRALPVGAELAPSGGVSLLIATGGRLVRTGITLAAPVLAALLVVDVAAAVLARIQPSLERAVAFWALRSWVAAVLAVALAAGVLRQVTLGVAGLETGLADTARALGPAGP